MDNMKNDNGDVSFSRKPEWLKVRLPHGFKTKDVV